MKPCAVKWCAALTATKTEEFCVVHRVRGETFATRPIDGGA